jgi:CRP-like cAMP-binding protein
MKVRSGHDNALPDNTGSTAGSRSRASARHRERGATSHGSTAEIVRTGRANEAPGAFAPGENRSGNHLLAVLSPADRELLRPELEVISLDVRQILERPGDLISHAYFVESGLVSIVGENQPHHRIEVGMVGFEGLTGLGIVLGADRSANEAVVQSAGYALRITTLALRDSMAISRTFTDTLLRFAHVFMVQSSNTALAAGRGKIDERLARGLLMWHDRIREDCLLVTHEFLALLLGVQRPGVTVALHRLEGKGLIRSTRSKVRILDRRGLQRAANGFYGMPEAEYDRFIGGALPRFHLQRP